ncbi:hypothetical protein ACA910_020006 [Epithemia clementina (nom. ined.)]
MAASATDVISGELPTSGGEEVPIMASSLEAAAAAENLNLTAASTADEADDKNNKEKADASADDDDGDGDDDTRGRSKSRTSSRRSRTPSKRSSSRGRPGSRLVASITKRASSKQRTSTSTSTPTQPFSAESAPEKTSTSNDLHAASSELFDAKFEASGTNIKTNNANTDTKRKSFRRIRGLLKGGGESHRSRRQSANNNNKSSPSLKAASSSADEQKEEVGAGADTHSDVPVSTVGANRVVHDDISTIYDVTVDERSGITGSPMRSPRKNNNNYNSQQEGDADDNNSKFFFLRMILLLMDIASRRFELLQLEFDSDKALVSDILEQVPESVTVQSLRGQTFDGIITVDGEEKPMGQRLAEFCTGNDILVAIPHQTSSREAARLAKQILSNPKIASMLISSGIDVPQWAHDAIANREIVFPDVSGEDEEEKGPAFMKYDPDLTKRPVRWGGSLLFAAIVLAMVATAVSYAHKIITMPIQPGQVVSPGVVLSKCGLLHHFSKDCDRAYLEVHSGKVLYYKGKELEWVIHGPICREDQIQGKACRGGLEFRNDLTLWLGGKPIKWLLGRQSSTSSSETTTGGATKANHTEHLTPWPFSVPPKIKSWEVAADQLESRAAAPATTIVTPKPNNKAAARIAQAAELESSSSFDEKAEKKTRKQPELVCTHGTDSCHIYQSWHRRVEIRRVRRRNNQDDDTHHYPSWRKLAAQAAAQPNETTLQKQ